MKESTQNGILSWEEELSKTAENYNIKVSWVAVIFNILFAATDYVNAEEHWITFLMVRIAVSSVTFAAIMLRKPLKLTSQQVVFVPFLLISFQNAFMWSLMDAELLQKHTLAYMALFIGAGMLIIWKIRFSVVIVVASIAANIFFLMRNSPLDFEQIMASGGLLTGSVAIFSILLIQTRYNLTKREIIARTQLASSNQQLTEQKGIIEANNRDIKASIEYAKKIQEAILPDNDLLNKHLSEHFVLFKPKDIVSGDFYWFARRESDDISMIAAIDCTGHGVPGAFMSMIGNTLLNEIASNESFTTPAEILFELRTAVIESLQQSGQVDNNEGMDMALCMIDHRKKQLQFAGAYNALYQVRGGELQETKADRMPIGNYHDRNDRPFKNTLIEYQEGDIFYIFSDGYIDQFGGPKGKKLTSKRFKQLVLELSDQPLSDQHKGLETSLADWQEDRDQIDDILVLGFRP